MLFGTLIVQGCVSSVEDNPNGNPTDVQEEENPGENDPDIDRGIIVNPPDVSTLSPADRNFSCEKDNSTEALCAYCVNDAKNIDADECIGLAAFYYWTTGSSWNASEDTDCFALYNGSNGTNWFGENHDVASWKYITVSEKHVTKIGLRGCINSGIIPNEISSLSKLTAIELINANLSGILPASLTSLEKLEKLTLSGNQLSGSIPADIGLLSNLHKLSLADNTLTGPIPGKVGKLSKLDQLYLNGNQFSKSLPKSLTENSVLVEYNYCENPDLVLPKNFKCESDISN